MEPHCKEKITEQYIGILKKELILSTGCTEPASIALAVSVLCDILGGKPDRIEAGLSKNIIKNVNSVTVPHTGGLRGIKTAVAAGIAAKGHRDGLNILGSLGADSADEISEYLSSVPVAVSCLESENVFEIDISGKSGAHTARVRLVGDHLNLVLAESDGSDVTEKYRQFSDNAGEEEPDYSLLSVKDIFDFAVSVDLSLVESILRPQIVCNSAISHAGLEGDFGASIGKLLYNDGNCSLKDKARAFAAAGSDARMNGCEKPVCIISGSGNQGMTASLPVIAYAEGLGADDEQLLRALLLSDLLTIHQKTGVGCLSAFCGAICAGGGAGCGICYLLGGGLEEISATLSNCAAMLSGTICDGAKSSCAAKIAMAVEAGITSAEMALRGKNFRSGDGIIADTVEKTIANVGRVANEGMRITDDVIINVLFDK